MQFLLALVLAATVEGVVTSDGAPLPGCIVTLESVVDRRTAVSDADGRYRILAVQPGAYQILFELPGMQSSERWIGVFEGVNVQSPEELAVSVIQEQITITTCGGGPPCQQQMPLSRWELPSCDDHELDMGLIRSMERGDPSAIALMRSRYARATTYAQKHRLAGALLGRDPDDQVYWDELSGHARNFIRFQTDEGHSEEFLKWCEERGYPPDEYAGMSNGAFQTIIKDRRSRALLLEALERGVPSLTDDANEGLALQRDAGAPPRQ
jgi:hypothetical protein